MPRMRVMSWVLFTLSLAFFFVEDFRWALRMPYLEWKDPSGEALELPASRLQALAERARQNRDAQSLAFAALHMSMDGGQDIALGKEAVAMDPSLTWIYYQLILRHRGYHGSGKPAWEPAFAPVLIDWTAKLLAFDPQNAAPYLLQAEAFRDQAKDFPDSLSKDAAHLAPLEKQADWTAAMEKAFSASRYDSYYVRRFDLERKVLRANGWASPDRILLLAFSLPIPNLMNIRNYANFKVLYLAPKAEGEKHHEEALRQYYATALFGQRMQVEGATLIEQYMGAAVDRIAAEPLEAALRKDGQNAQAELVAFSSRRFRRDHPGTGARDPLAASSNQLWAILAAHILSLLVAGFVVATLLCAFYLNAKRWIRAERRGRIFQFVTGLVNYLGVLLFVSCAALFLVCVPYATNLRYYMTAPGEVRSLEPLFTNTYPFLATDWQWGDSDLLMQPMHHYIHWAAVGLVLLALLGWLKKRFAPAAPPAASAR